MSGNADARELVGERLRAQRLRRGLSLRQLGRRAGISASAISEFERGKTWPKVQTLCVLADELELSLDALFAGIVLHSARTISR